MNPPDLRGGTNQSTLRLTTQKSFQSQTVYQQEQTEESQLDVQKVPGWFNYKFVERLPTDIAKTIMARDFKGFSSGFDSTNGVIEWK